MDISSKDFQEKQNQSKLTKLRLVHPGEKDQPEAGQPGAEKIRQSAEEKKPKKGLIIFLLVASLIFGFIGGLFALAFYANQDRSLNLPGVSQGSTTIKVTEDSDLTRAVEKILPSVVSIVSLKSVQGVLGEISQKGGGTGFIITQNGLIMTNKHVVADSNATYKVFTNDGKGYDAKVESIDPTLDLAILKIDAKNLSVVDLGDSDDVKIGQHVVAVGNALGEFQNTVTSGIISAFERTIEASDASGEQTEELYGLLQTDAAINYGNSGGPLINLAGQVVAINVAVASLSESQGIGFAIPINFAKTALKSYEKYGEIVRAFLGVRFIQLTPEVAQANDLAVDFGALVYVGGGQSAIVSGSPADKAGLKEGDIIIEVNEEKIDENHGLVRLLQQYMPGNEVEIKYLRDGSEHTAKIKLGELKAD